MAGFVLILIVLIIAGTIITWKYLDKVKLDDISYSHFHRLMCKLESIETKIDDIQKEE